jgi:hypothetical protein
MGHQTEMSGEYDRSLLFDITRIILPAALFIFFLISGTVILIYVFYVHQAVPTNYTVGASITFGILTVLLAVGHLLLYYRRRNGYDYWDRRAKRQETNCSHAVMRCCVGNETPAHRCIPEFDKERELKRDPERTNSPTIVPSPSRKRPCIAIELEDIGKIKGTGLSKHGKSLQAKKSNSIYGYPSQNPSQLHESSNVPMQNSRLGVQIKSTNPVKVTPDVLSEMRKTVWSNRWSHHSDTWSQELI